MKKAAAAILFLSLAVALVSPCALRVASVQSAREGESREETRERMVKLLEYVGIEKATQAEVDGMVEAWTRAARPGLSVDERTAAFRDLYVQFKKLQGVDYSGRPQAVAGLARAAATLFQAGARLDLRLPEPRGPVSGDYIHVEARGRGRVPLLLIADAGVDGRELYRSFVERNEGSYRFYIVTLPGAGAARPQPWPEVFDVTRRPWLNNIEQSLARLVEKRARAGKLVVVGTAIGGYFAARLALSKPEKISAAVLVNAQVKVALPSPASPDRPATLQERLALFKGYAPSPQLFPSAEVPREREEIKRLLDDPKSTHPTVKNWMAFAVKDEALSKRWSLEALSGGFLLRGIRYGAEIQTTDLTEDFARLSVPTLAMIALPDARSPVAATAAGAAQWAEIKRLYPSIPLTLATFAATRSYISEDNPAEFDRTLADFLSGLAALRPKR
ncbi:MAG: alpha/beta hydrolase [Acidobacteriota bacterium]|nr:alpha/beta hydrolase [Acidobacteriota bacterium]MDQ5835256.1 alpha/beta hydrolase [Acidobacteriota bacterium]